MNTPDDFISIKEARNAAHEAFRASFTDEQTKLYLEFLRLDRALFAFAFEYSDKHQPNGENT